MAELDDSRLATYQAILGERRASRLEAVLAARTRELVVVLENLHDSHNLSAVLRSADAFGIQEVHIIDRTGDFVPARKISQGCHKWLDLVVHETVDGAVTSLHRAGYRLLASTLAADSVPLEKLSLEGPLAVVFGNESDGLSQELSAACDGAFTVPMQGFSQSLNVSVAAAVTLHSLRSARSWSPLAEPYRQSLRHRWYAQAVKQAQRIADALEQAGDAPEVEAALQDAGS